MYSVETYFKIGKKFKTEIAHSWRWHRAPRLLGSDILISTI